MLHTWKQDLARHVHAHALMAGGVLGIEGRWVAAKPGFLFPIKALSKVFRGKFVAALKAARQDGKLHEAQLAAHAWRNLLSRVHKHDWVVYAKEPPGGPEQVLDYLGRHTHRVAISNERILDIGADTVSVCACAIGPRATAGARSGCRRKLSSSVSCCMYCPRFQAHSPLRADRSSA